MRNGIIFFILACSILVLSIININTGPIVTLTVGADWGDLNCQMLSDEYDYQLEEEELNAEEEKVYEYLYGDPIDRCHLRIGMYYLEHITFVIDIIIGFICGMLGFVHYLKIELELVPKTGLIGVVCGIIGFILTFIYTVYNGLVYTKDFYVLNTYYLFFEYGVYKRDADGAYAEMVSPGRYKCLFYKDYGDFYSLIAKYSDYIKKQYNYNKDLYDNYYDNEIINKCTIEDYVYDCVYDEYIEDYITYTDNDGEYHFCPKIYLEPLTVVKPRNISNKFLATLILSLFICLCSIGLIVFGLLLFLTPIY